MCIDMKISKQVIKDRSKAKYELGNFFEQYGLLPVAPSKRKHKHSKTNQKYKRHFNKGKKLFSNSNKFYEKPN